MKNNNKKKVYQLNYIDENDLYNGRYYNNKIYRNYNSNDVEYNNLNSHKKNSKHIHKITIIISLCWSNYITIKLGKKIIIII